MESPSELFTRGPTSSKPLPSTGVPSTATTSSPSKTHIPGSSSMSTRLLSKSVFPPSAMAAIPTPGREGKSRGVKPRGFGIVTSKRHRSPGTAFTRDVHSSGVALHGTRLVSFLVALRPLTATEAPIATAPAKASASAFTPTSAVVSPTFVAGRPIVLPRKPTPCRFTSGSQPTDGATGWKAEAMGAMTESSIRQQMHDIGCKPIFLRPHSGW
mmetsp:Transcript_50481/g.117854  ORF Transcript_50481/g.117854 Transcript_50481/m.117854 type:complete len:213 (-) Transcript_50481:34-672(-)